MFAQTTATPMADIGNSANRQVVQDNASADRDCTAIIRFHFLPISHPDMNYCSHCGSGVELKVPDGDHLPRHVCSSCGLVHYQNPRIIVGCIPVWENRILICKRAIEPRHGYWTLPAGFMENNETVADGATREALEEALADVEITSLQAVINVLHTQQVHMMFRAQLRHPSVGAGEESLEVKLVTPDEIPWADLAFRSVRYSLERYLDDLKTGFNGVHMHTLA